MPRSRSTPPRSDDGAPVPPPTTEANTAAKATGAKSKSKSKPKSSQLKPADAAPVSATSPSSATETTAASAATTALSSPGEAHPLVDVAALKRLQGSYRSGGAETLVDPDWLRQARLRRRQLGETMRAFDVATAEQRLPDANDYVISRKIDGEFTCLVYRDGTCLSLNPGGTVRVGAPFHLEAANLLRAAGIRSAFLGGELHVRRSDGQRPRVHDVTRIARNPASDAEVDSLCFAVFDVYLCDDEDFSHRYLEAMILAKRLFGAGDHIQPVPFERGDRHRVFQLYRQWVEQEGAEGVVLRSASSGLFKVKPRHSLDLAIIGFSEGIDERAGLLHSLLLAVPIDADSFQLVGRVGGGFSDEARASLLVQLSERVVASDYVEVNSDQVGYRMIDPGLVAEISCLDVVSRTSLGSSIDRMLLDWRGPERRWEGVRRLPLCSLISPQFVRLREDKQATPDQVRLAQLTDIAEIPETERQVEGARLPQSTLLERAVATKTLKGATMVRKLLLWKTNKETVSRDFPAYVLHLTDYSPNRETPLNHDIRVSRSEQQIRDFYSQWRQNYFVGGWHEVNAKAP